MIPATIHQTQGHPLARMHTEFGVDFLGTKAELQAAGFGVSAVFPGEPGGHKKTVTLCPCNGFSRVTVDVYDGRAFWLGEPTQTASTNYVVSARYLAENSRTVRTFEPTQWTGVSLHRANWHDVYRGTMDALVAAELAAPGQFPDQPGCGKVRTTFGRDGKRVTAGSNTAAQEGNRTVLVAGKRFEVLIRVSDAIREIRHAQYCAESDLQRSRAKQELAAMHARRESPPRKPSLRLVWSA